MKPALLCVLILAAATVEGDNELYARRVRGLDRVLAGSAAQDGG